MDFELIWNVMKWPILACILLPGILVYYGLHIVKRQIIFVDLALAQVAALGTSIALISGFEPGDTMTFVLSLAFTLLGALLFTLMRKHRNPDVPQEALIGIVYVVAAALGILVLSQSAEGNEELKRTLVGDVLLVGPARVLKTFALFAAIGVVHFIFRRRFLALSFSEIVGETRTVPSLWWEFWFYALFGLIVTSFVQIGGVLMVFSYLIVPAVCANYLARTMRMLLLLGWLVATGASAMGLIASFQFDWPTGAAIVCSLGAWLVIIMGISIGRDKFRTT